MTVPPSPPPLTGLVLAGGASRRMGRDKARLVVEGELLAVRVVRRLRAGCDRVLIASGDGDRLPGIADGQVADAVPDAGPLAGILAGLEAARTPLVAVVAVDMPFADVAVLEVLASHWDGEVGVVPRVDGRVQPLHAVYATAAAADLRRCLGEGRRGVVDVVTALGARVVDQDAWAAVDPTSRFAVNVNEPGDLDRLADGPPPAHPPM